MLLSLILCNFLVQTLQYLNFFFSFSFAHKKLKNPPQKVAYLWHLGFFFSAALTAQNDQIHIGNVSEDTSAL